MLKRVKTRMMKTVMTPRREFDLIKWIKERVPVLPASAAVGIGDDCAVLPTSPQSDLLVTSDMMVENVDFRRTWIPPRFLGVKSLAVGVSDLAAMGAKPQACLLALALPPDCTETYFEGLMTGFLEGSARWRVPLVGGDISQSPLISLTVTAFGTAPSGSAVRRCRARPGDVVGVIGGLGLSRLGLQLLQAEDPALADEIASLEELEVWARTRDRFLALQAHLLPRPLLAEGIWLREQNVVHAMIDVSDGLASDLSHILEESGVAVDLDGSSLDWLATTEGGARSRGTVLDGGEDYALLFTMSPEQYDRVVRTYPSDFPPFVQIGKIIPGPPSIHICTGDGRERYVPMGFEHFQDLP